MPRRSARMDLELRARLPLMLRLRKMTPDDSWRGLVAVAPVVGFVDGSVIKFYGGVSLNASREINNGLINTVPVSIFNHSHYSRM